MGAALDRTSKVDSAEDAGEEALSGTLSARQRLPLQVFFLEALYNFLEDRLKSLYKVERKKWDDLGQQIKRLQLSLCKNNADVISKTIDRWLKPFVQNDEVLMPALKAYLPDRDETWEHFREIKLKSMNDRERRVFRENDGQTVTALKTLRRVVRMFAFAFAFETGGADAKKTTDREKTLDVFYAAHRDRIEEKGIGQPCEQADTLHYGWAKVSIPKGHQAGILETPWRAEDAESNEYVEKKFEFQFRDEEAFVKKINESIQQSGHFSGQALLYIHGFNVLHDKAIKNAAQLSTDLKFHGGGGIVIAYIWPSKGSLVDYKDDAAVIETSADYLHQFITTILSKKVHFSKVHILAHSMGNRALIKAMTRYYRALNSTSERSPATIKRERGKSPLDAKEGPQPKKATIRGRSSTYEFGSSSGAGSSSSSGAEAGAGKVEDLRKLENIKLVNIIFAAADETRDKFDDMLSAAKRAQNVEDLPGFTIYSSITDRALRASMVYNRQMRLGDTKSLVQHTQCIFKHVPKMDSSVDVVDASGLTCKMDAFLHSYYAKADSVLSDIQTLLTTSHRADVRSKRHKIIHKVQLEDWHFFAFEQTFWEHPQKHLFLHSRDQCLFCIL